MSGQDRGRVDEAVAAGVRVLAERRRPDGLWCDFVLPGRSAGSTECVSAFAAAQLGAVPEGRALAREVVRRLLPAQRGTGGWGYREDVPEDCDSTAWVLIGADRCAVEVGPKARAAARSFLLGHQHDDGGFVTYLPSAKAVLTPADEAGWFEPEVSVTASALMALAADPATPRDRLEAGRAYLLRHRREGLWTSYWWRGFAYATLHAWSAVQAVGPRDDVDAGSTARAVRGARTDTVFSIALALRTLLTTGSAAQSEPAVEPLVQYLLGGDPAGDAEMLAPGAAAYGRELVLRDAGVVTVAAVVGALDAWRRRMSGNPCARPPVAV